MLKSLKARFAAVAAAAVMVLAAGLGVTAAGAANAATPSCGPSCADIFSENFGSYHNPNFVMDVKGQSTATGTPVILFRQSNSDPAEDFTFADQGTVDDFYSAGLMSPQIHLHYGNDIGFELEYSPYGADTGMCAGVASTAVQGEQVTLQPCGVSSKTVWVIDTTDPTGLSNPFRLPAINGSDTNFSHPYALTYPAGAYPTDSPRPVLTVKTLTGFFSQPVLNISTDQLWGSRFGVLP